MEAGLIGQISAEQEISKSGATSLIISRTACSLLPLRYLATRPELEDIEASARFFEDEDGLHIHSFFFYEDAEDHAGNSTVAFTIREGRLSLKCGLDRTYVSGIERGLRNPTLEVIAILATGLGIEMKTLIEF